MRWEDERYVRLYTRDTADWLALSFEAQGLLALILRKVDRAGLMPLGKQGKKAVAVTIGHGARWKTLAPALEELLADGCIAIRGDTLVVPNFIEAQEAAASDAQRKRESRARARDLMGAESRNVTESHECPDGGHNLSQPVTPNCAVPSRAEPPEPAQARAPAAEVAAPPPPPSVASGLPKAHVARFEHSLRLLDALEAQGWQAGLPKQEPDRCEVEDIVRRVTVEVAAQRLMAMVREKRAAGVEVKPWLGWHKSVILGKQTGPPEKRGMAPVGQDFTKTLEDVLKEAG